MKSKYKVGEVILLNESLSLRETARGKFCKIIDIQKEIEDNRIWQRFSIECLEGSMKYHSTETFFLKITERKATKKESEAFEQKLIEEAI